MDQTLDQHKETVDVTLAWASEISDLWVGTPYSSIIDARQAAVVKYMDRGQTHQAVEQAELLAELLNQAEEEYGE